MSWKSYLTHVERFQMEGAQFAPNTETYWQGKLLTEQDIRFETPRPDDVDVDSYHQMIRDAFQGEVRSMLTNTVELLS